MFNENEKNEIDNMDESSIIVPELKFASFENAKRSLQTFAKRSTADFGLKHVPSSGGLFGLGDHKVTGDELNKVTGQVQEYLTKINGISIDIIREIGQVYNAFESLDKQYIPAILSAIGGAKIASNQAKAAADHAKVAQEDIRKSVQEQKKIIRVLEDHKAKLDKLKHLSNIDDIWNASKKLEKESNEIRKQFNESKKDISRLAESIKALQSFAEGILDYEHLEDIDAIWDRMCDAEENVGKLFYKIDVICTAITECNQKIDDLQFFMEDLKKYEHLSEIDSIWGDLHTFKENVDAIEKFNKNINHDFLNLAAEYSETQRTVDEIAIQEHVLEIDDVWSRIENISSLTEDLEKEKERQTNEIMQLKEMITEEKNSNDLTTMKLKNRIIIAYSVAGVSFGLTLANILLNILGVF